MAYQPSWDTYYECHHCRKIVVVLFNLSLKAKSDQTFCKGISEKVNVIT